jgi:hypothetical protein
MVVTIIMKRSSSQSKTASSVGVKTTKSEELTPPVLKEPVPVSETTPVVAKRTRKPKDVVDNTVTPSLTDVIPPPSTPIKLESSVGILDGSIKVSEKSPSGGEQVDAETSNVALDEFEFRCSEFFNSLRDLVNKASELKSEYKSIERTWVKRLKSVSKTGGKKKKKSGVRAPSGFVKPTLISNELAQFLGKTPGTEMARTEVTREINVYIRTNGLQDAANGRKINADSALSGLLKLSPTDELTYFNLQKYMSSHFPKNVPATATVV